METNKQLTRVLEIPLKNNGDYDRDNIDYVSGYQWSENDKANIEHVINEEIYPAKENKGEKIVVTSCGEVLLTYQKHPKVDRRKLIQGFLQSRPFVEGERVSSLVKEFIPDFKERCEEAKGYLIAIDELIDLTEENVIGFKQDIFLYILQAIKENADKYTDSENEVARVHRLISNIKDICQILLNENCLDNDENQQ